MTAGSRRRCGPGPAAEGNHAASCSASDGFGGAFVVAGKKAEEEIGGLAGLRRRADYGVVILAQNIQPGGDVIGVPHRRHDAERGAAEAAFIGDQLLEGILFRAEGT